MQRLERVATLLCVVFFGCTGLPPPGETDDSAAQRAPRSGDGRGAEPAPMPALLPAWRPEGRPVHAPGRVGAVTAVVWLKRSTSVRIGRHVVGCRPGNKVTW